MRNPEESRCNPDATFNLNRGQLVAHRTASEQEILQSGAPTELSLSYLRTLQNFIFFYTFLLQTRSYSTKQPG
jgi:hypothetical protein